MPDYIDPRIWQAVDRAVSILLAHSSEWRSEVDAYWLLVRYEDDVGVPVIYELVREAVERARAILAQKQAAAVEEAA